MQIWIEAPFGRVGWMEIATHVEKLITEAKIEELENQIRDNSWIDQRITELRRQLEEIK